MKESVTFKLSIVTNVSNADLPRISNIIPHWLNVFDKYIDELLIIFDDNDLSGRIETLHKVKYSSAEILEALENLKKLDGRICIKKLDRSVVSSVYSIWYKKGTPLRCQSGSPIYPFIFALHESKNDFILKCDCDILFFQNGFVDHAFNMLNEFDIVTPPRNLMGSHIMSSRAYFINKGNFYKNLLPIKLPRLSLPRIIVKLLRGQNLFDKNKYSMYLSFEDSINLAIKQGKIKHHHLGKTYGNSLHVISNTEASDPFIKDVIESFARGRWPAVRNYQWTIQKFIGRNLLLVQQKSRLHKNLLSTVVKI